MWSLENGDCSILSAGACVVLTMMLVDMNTRWYKVHQSNFTRTIRDLAAPEWLQYLMSSAQFHATVHCLLTSNRLSVQIAALTVVQLSAFGMMICFGLTIHAHSKSQLVFRFFSYISFLTGMTLRRKGFISQQEGVVLYAVVLVLGMHVIYEDLSRRNLMNMAFFFGNISAALRMYLCMNKYYLWMGIAVALTVLLKNDMLNDDLVPFSLAANISSWVILLGTCYLKHC